MPTNSQLTYFAQFPTDNNRPIGITLPDRRFHFYAIGRTGTGKSTLLFSKIVQDLRAGRGVGVIDPHGDLAESLLPFIPGHRQNDLVYINPADLNYPVGLNLLEPVEESERHLVAANLLSIFHKLWSDSWGPRLEHLLRNAFLVLLDYPESTLLHLVRLLNDEPFRNRVVKRCRDPLVRNYWQQEFAAYPPRLLPEIISPAQNKVGAYLSNRPLRNMLSQSRTRVNIQQLMDDGGILIVNLAKGRIGEDAANLLGSLLVTKVQLSAMARARLPEDQRRDFYFYADEFHNFTTGSFADILSEARKYRLNLTIANQGLFQLDKNIRDAVLANVGTLVIFRVGPEDARILGSEFGESWPWTNLVNLNPHEIWFKLLRHGRVERPRQAMTLPPPQVNFKDVEKYKQELIEGSRRRYAWTRAKVEQKISRFLGNNRQV
jgi:hypothetical protein